MAANVQHSQESKEHYTPKHVADSVHWLLGGIDLDPASCAEANTVIRATRFYTETDGGLFLPWAGRVFLNPPGGTLQRKSLQPGKGFSASAVWWARLVTSYRKGEVGDSVFLAFSLNLFQTAQQLEGVPAPYAFPFVVPSSRLTFWGPGERSGPSQPNAVVYLGSNPQRFREAFSYLGEVRL
jgi:ParB family chromosome partitioning protein